MVNILREVSQGPHAGAPFGHQGGMLDGERIRLFGNDRVRHLTRETKTRWIRRVSICQRLISIGSCRTRQDKAKGEAFVKWPRFGKLNQGKRSKGASVEWESYMNMMVAD